MKKSLTATQRKRIYFTRLRALAIAALVCSVVLAIAILVECWLPGKASAGQSDKVSAALRPSAASYPDYTGVLSAFGINVSVKASYKIFVRKFFGHFLPFTVLGFGFAFTFFLTVKPRFLYAMSSMLASAVVAALSEMLQLPIFTTGRAFSPADIGVDCFGAACGIAVASLVILVYAAIKKAVDKEDYTLLKQTLKDAPSIFTSTAKIAAAYDDSYKKV